MKKQSRDAISLFFRLYLSFFAVGLLIGVPIDLLDQHREVHRLSLGFIIGLDTLLTSIGIVIFFVSIVITTKRHKDDPFRFAREYKAYFQVPGAEKHSTLSKLGTELEKAGNCKRVSKSELIYTWVGKQEVPFVMKSPIYSGVDATKIERKITIRSLEMLDTSDFAPLEVVVEPTSPWAQGGSQNANFKALSEFIQIAGWTKLQVKVDQEGNPRWSRA